MGQTSRARGARLSASCHLDGLRGVVAFVVVVTHGIVASDYALYSGAERDSRCSWDVQLSGAPLLLPLAGNLSVCIFFALSGYVLCQSFSNSRLGSIGLFAKRYIRLAIPILAACMIAYTSGVFGWPRNAQLSAIPRSGWLAGQMRQVPSFNQAFQESAYRALIHLKPYWINVRFRALDNKYRVLWLAPAYCGLWSNRPRAFPGPS
jgi:peptidoglycan/LPS O-acetylase OafA/YrhL